MASPRCFDYGSFLIQAVIARRNDEAICSHRHCILNYIYLVTIALCARRPRNAEKIKPHGHEVGLCDKGGLIFYFVVAFSVYLLRGRQKREKN
jgi:hypothetical protein